MKFRRTILSIGAISAIAAPVAAVVSCGQTKINYDFGVATSSINSLNYVRNKDTAVVAPSLVEGLIKTAPASKTLKSLLKISPLNLNFAEKGGSEVDTAVDSFTEDGRSPAVIHDSVNNFKSMVGVYKDGGSYSDGFKEMGIQLNGGLSKWSNGEPVTATDFVDSMKYIFDINTGSQYLTDALDIRIKNSQAIVDAQVNYYKNIGTAYIDPFGYDGFESQNQGDDAYVAAIKAAADGFGYYSGDTKVPVWKDDFFGEDNPKHQVDSKYQLFMTLEDEAPMKWTEPLTLFGRSWMAPINRKFVESHGGIRKFGSDKATFLWNGPFDPEDIVLGPQGHITLVKNYHYFESGKTMSDRIKIYFQDNPVITSSMYEDGYISQTSVPAAYMMQFWSDPEVRPTLSKNGGYGTIGLQLNLDEESNTNPAMQDQDFRKALEYGIDRNEMLKMAGWDASFPVSTWTAFGQATDTLGMPIETYFDHERYIPYERYSGEARKIQSYTWLDHSAKGFKFEHVDRTDNSYDPEIANHFLDVYKKNHPNQKSVTISYLYNGSAEGKNAGIALQAQMKKVFGGYVNVEIKGLPSYVFEDYRVSGKFDVVYFNFDSYGTDKDSYVRRFVLPDGIDKSQGDTTGFKINPSGSWTFDKYIRTGKNDNPDRAKALFDHGDAGKQPENFKALWNEFINLFKRRADDTDTTIRTRTDNFFHGLDGGPDETVINMISLLEKVIKDGCPVIPLMEVDTKWTSSRILGAGALTSFSLQYAYDVDKKPISTLPGREALGK